MWQIVLRLLRSAWDRIKSLGSGGPGPNPPPPER